MKWLFSVVRMFGASFPFASSLVQLQAEVDSAAVRQRLLALEDPISTLHPDIRKLSEKLYNGLAAGTGNLDKALAAAGVAMFRFDDAFAAEYGKPLAILEKKGFIEGTHSIGGPDFDRVYLRAPEYFGYLCALYEEPSKMDRLVEILDTCKRGQWLLGEKIAPDLQLPLPVVKAFFRLYEERGLGECSREIGVARYVGRA